MIEKKISLLAAVSSIPFAFGGAAISGEGGGYGFGDICENDALELLLKAKEFGVKIFDTAPIYGFGLSEQRIGKAFKKCRDEVFIVSKSGVDWHDNKRVNMSNDPKITEKMLHRSLKDLDSDYIDLYMIHWPDPRVDIRRPLEVLSKAYEQKKILHIGLCNTNMDDLLKASEICEIKVVQSQLNLFSRDALKEIVPYCIQNEISFMSWGTLDKGILSRRVTSDRKYDRIDARSWAPWWDKKEVVKKVEVVNGLCERFNLDSKDLLGHAIAHNLQYKNCVPIVGARNLMQLIDVLDVIQKKMDHDLLQEIVTYIDSSYAES